MVRFLCQLNARRRKYPISNLPHALTRNVHHSPSAHWCTPNCPLWLLYEWVSLQLRPLNTEKNGMINNRNPSNQVKVFLFVCLFFYVLETTYLLVCISAGLQQPKQAERLTSACREMRRRLSVSRTIQTIHSKPAFKKITRTVLLNGDSMKPHFNQNTYDFLKAR